MRKIIVNKIIKRTGFGLGFVLLSYVIGLSGLQNFLLNVKFGYPPVDFMYVLAVSFLPGLIAMMGYGILFSVAFLLARHILLPVHRVERHYLGIKGGGTRKYIFITALIVLLLFIVPYFMTESLPFGGFLTGVESSVMQLGSALSGLYLLGSQIGLALEAAAKILLLLLDLMFIKPLFIFYPVRIDALLASLFMASLFYHSAMVSFSKKRLKIERQTSTHLCQQGEEVVMRTSLRSPLPAPNVSLPLCSVPWKKMESRKNKAKGDLLSTRFENTESISLKEGYYNFDIVPIRIFTFPFFHTTIYRVCDANCDVSVLPKLHFKTRVAIRQPIVEREAGSLVRMQLGSSMDFAGMREYAHDDPLSRIWWKGLAKYGKLLVKEFHSFGEDRWMLILDFSNPNLREEGIQGMLQFSRLFIELCTRKDIAIGLSTFSPTFHYTDYTTSKKNLLSSLAKVTSPLCEISPKGIEMIMKDALGSEIERLKIKCRRKNMTLSMVYSYSGLGKQKTFFSWSGKRTFKDCTKKFFVDMRRSGKILLLTDGSPKNLEMFKKFKAICMNRRCSYLFVVTQPQKDVLKQLRDAQIKAISASEEELKKPGFVMKLVSLV